MKAVLVDKLLFHLVRGKDGQTAFFLKASQHFRLNPDEVPFYRRGLCAQTGEIPPIVNCLEKSFVVYLEVRSHVGGLQFREDGFVEESDLKKKIFLEGLLIHAELLSPESHCCDPTALTVPAVMHLDGGLKDMAAAHGDVAGKPGDAAPPLLRILY